MALSKYRVPGVYVEEQSAIPYFVHGLPTSIPAFIGYTEKAKKDEKLLLNQPVRVSSLSEFERWFGKGLCTKFELIDYVSGSGRIKFKYDGKKRSLSLYQIT